MSARAAAATRLTRLSPVGMSSPLGERAKHDVGVHVLAAGMVKRAGERTDDAEPEPLPESDRRIVGGHDEVELHRPKSQSPCLRERMLAHGASDAEAACIG